jgi:adenosylmethionine-8-amino-7-oxononanoate aminotransferase
MTGLGRTAKNFAIGHWDVIPDVIATGKVLAGGYIPLAAVNIKSKIPQLLEERKVFFSGDHRRTCSRQAECCYSHG